MSLEFVAKKGFITPLNAIVTGSLTVLNGISGSHFGTSSWAVGAISSSVATTTTNTFFFFDLSTGSSVIQPTYVGTNLLYNPFTNQISGSSLGITASHFGNTVGTASYAQTASNGAFAWGKFTFNGTAITQSTYNCSITRSALGTYPIRFTQSAATPMYATIFNGGSGSRLTPTTLTQSFCNFINLSVNSFTMSAFNVANAASDVVTASFVVFSY